MSSKKTPPSLRVLILALNLINTRIGMTQQELLELVPGYGSGQLDSLRRTFERDIALLRDSGLVVQLSEDSIPRYSILPGVAGEGAPVLDEQAFELAVRAARAWEVDQGEADALVNKLRGLTDGVLGEPEHSVDFKLEGSPVAAAVGQGIARSQPLGFEYASRSGKEYREVAPWRLVARGRALYLWGFDLNRWGARLFRLSRFRSVPDLLAEPGATPAEGNLQEAAFSGDHFLVTPTLLIREGAAPLVRARSAPKAGRTPPGWERYLGRSDDVAAWEQVILREAKDVFVVEPEEFSQRLFKQLQLAGDTASVVERGANG